MIYVNLPDAHPRRLTFYLATEEYVARRLPAGEYFFMWQVEPTVIFGRNQLIRNEVNLDYCREHGINMCRRKSGGGCVYADMNNIMFSYITEDENVSLTFNRYIMMVVAVLRKLGVDATTSGRNDILVDGRKVSGNAFYHLPGRSIVHGTMLYDTDVQNMVGSITPNDAKLVSKGVSSVRQRINLLKDYIDLDIEGFKQYVRTNLCDDQITLSDEDLLPIQIQELEYVSPAFIYGHNPHYNIVRRGRIEGVGEMEVRLQLKNDVICRANVLGDYFLVGDIDNRLLQPLRGVKLDAEAVGAALPPRLDDIILNLEKDDFVKLLVSGN